MLLTKHEIAFIDRNVDSLTTLLAGLRPQVEPILLSNDEPALRQMAAAVQYQTDLTAIHVIAHGRPGEVSFGSGALAFETLEKDREDLAAVGNALGSDGDLLLWSCRTGEGERGAAFIEGVARATGAQVEIKPLAETPTVAIRNTALTVSAGGSVPLGVQVTPVDADDVVSVTISGLTSYETITNNLDQSIFSGSSVTLSAAEVNSGLTLHSSYAGSDHPVNNLTLVASNSTSGEAASSAAQTIVVTDPPAISSSQIDTEFSGISITSTYPPQNGLAVGPNNILMVEGSRIEWTNLAGGSPTLQSTYNFFSSLSPTGGLYDQRCVYDSVNQRYIVIMQYAASGATISGIDIAVSKDSNPNDGWYFASLNTSLTINGQLTGSDRPMLSADGTNIYITAAQFNVNISGYVGTESWVIGDTAGPGGGIFNGGTPRGAANALDPR